LRLGFQQGAAMVEAHGEQHRPFRAQEQAPYYEGGAGASAQPLLKTEAGSLGIGKKRLASADYTKTVLQLIIRSRHLAFNRWTAQARFRGAATGIPLGRATNLPLRHAEIF
jgi:hypothetical protein